jgi:hypothetical protein
MPKLMGGGGNGLTVTSNHMDVFMLLLHFNYKADGKIFNQGQDKCPQPRINTQTSSQK